MIDIVSSINSAARVIELLQLNPNKSWEDALFEKRIIIDSLRYDGYLILK